MCGVKGDGTEQTTPLRVQAAVTTACGATYHKLEIPASFKIGISSAIIFNGCIGLDFGGQSSAQMDAWNTSVIQYIGSTAISGPLLSINQVAASRFHDFQVLQYNPSTHAAQVDAGIDVTESGTVYADQHSQRRTHSISRSSTGRPVYQPIQIQ